jgi:hypothetical protein
MKAEEERTAADSLEGRTKVEPGGADTDSFKRAEAAMRVVIAVCLLLDFALVCLAAVQHFHV